MTRTVNQNEEIFDTMHKLEQAGMSRDQAEITARTIDRQISYSRQEFLDKIDERFDMMDKKFDAKFELMDKRFEARFELVEKRLKWLYVESLVAIGVVGAGFIGVIIALLRLG